MENLNFSTSNLLWMPFVVRKDITPDTDDIALF
jgi:hypothetical protein